MKDRLRDWILCHERFYWYIIVGLAVFAFGVVTAFGFAKVQKAHAAQTSGGVYYPDLCDINFGSNYDTIKSVVESYSYFAVFESEVSYFFVFDNQPFKLGSTSFGYCDLTVGANTNSALKFTVSKSDLSLESSQFNICTSIADTGLLGANHDFFKYDNAKDIEYIYERLPYPSFTKPVPVLYTYNVSAPYVDNVTVSINNVLPIDYKTIDIECSEWVVNYDIITPWFTGTDYKLVNKYYVWLPTKDYFDKLYAGWYFPLDVENGMTINDLDLHTLKSDITAFQKNVGKTDRGICYTFLKEESVSNGRVKYDYRDFLESIQEAYGHEDVNGEWVDFSLADYYGFKETDSEWLNLYRPVLMSFLYVSRMDSLLYCSVEDSNYYGPYMVFDFLPEKFEGVTTKIEVDPLNTENLNSIIETGRLESLKNEMYTVAGENDSLSNQLGSIDLTLGAFGNGLSGSDLWTGFSSLSAGLASLVPSITSVAFLIGSVFSFLPVQLTTILAFTLLALCIIAIIKAIRG